MMTSHEIAKMNTIKARVDANEDVSPLDKQWVIDIYVRERIPATMTALRKAQRQGFQVAGLVTA